jgi:hypothetical protein
MGKTLEQVTAWQESTARKELPVLDELAQELEALARDMLIPPITYQRLDSANIMALSFVAKQREHLRSVRTLIAAGSYRDSLLIGRTMLEAWGRLRWAFNLVPDRTDLWFWFGAILDRRQMEKNKQDGIVVDPADEAALQPYINQHGPNYYRPDVRKALAKAQQIGTPYTLPPDPWNKYDWTDTKLRAMFEELGEVRLYDSFYRRSSEWGHSGPRAVIGAADPQQVGPDEWGPDEFTDEDVVSGVWALGIACETLYRCLDVLNRRFALGHDARVNDLGQRVNAVFAASLASAP